VYDVKDWAEVMACFDHRERWSKRVIADKLGMSRKQGEPTARPERRASLCTPMASALGPFVDGIVATLDENRNVAATVILERLRRLSYSITSLMNRLQRLGPVPVAARSYQRTSYS
jgi:hypothetical protein